MQNFIKNYIEQSASIKQNILNDEMLIKTIENIANKIILAYKNGNKVLIAGNGGSSSDAQHIACELVSKFYMERAPLSAISLSTNTSLITAIGNDYGFENIFSRQIEANGNNGDIFLALSTSGNSENIVKALAQAKLKGLICVGLTGKSASAMDNLCDLIIKIPSTDTPKIQESHIMVAHIICAIVELNLNSQP